MTETTHLTLEEKVALMSPKQRDLVDRFAYRLLWGNDRTVTYYVVYDGMLCGTGSSVWFVTKCEDLANAKEKELTEKYIKPEYREEFWFAIEEIEVSQGVDYDISKHGDKFYVNYFHDFGFGDIGTCISIDSDYCALDTNLISADWLKVENEHCHRLIDSNNKHILEEETK